MKTVRLLALVVAVAALLGGIASSSPACTGIRIETKDGAVIYARTMEFAADMAFHVAVVPRGFEEVGTAPGDKPGMAWKTTYAAVGANCENLPFIIDGLNEKGLGTGIFYFPGYVQYQEIAAGNAGKAMAPWELTGYLLGSCADVPQAVEAARKVFVGAVVQKQLGIVPPCHFIVHDAAGRCAVLEYVEGKLVVYSNPLGVITNSPGFDWHLTNLRNYLNLSPANAAPKSLSGMRFSAFGQGSGMRGLPGDFTPPSRFVRAVALTQSALPVETAREGVLQAFHILNQFDIPKGAARRVSPPATGRDFTPWTAALRPAEPALLFPHLREPPHPHGRFEEDGPGRQAGEEHLDGRRRGDRGPLCPGEAAVRRPASMISCKLPKDARRRSPSPFGRGPG